MKGICDRIRDSKAIDLAYALQKDAEHESQVALQSVAHLKASRAAGLALAPKAAGIWSVPHHPSSRSVENGPDCVVAHVEQEIEVIPLGEHSARSQVNRNLPRHKVSAWMVVEGKGNDRGEEFGIGNVSRSERVSKHGGEKGIG